MFATSEVLASGSGSVYSMLWPALPDLVWGSLAFAIVAFVIYRLAWPKYSQMLDERTEKIDNGLKAAEIARAEIASEREDLAVEVTNAQREAALIREKAQDNAKSIISDAQAKARVDAAAIVAGAQKRIDADAQAATHSLRSDLGTVATELAGKILGEAITDQALASRVIDRFLDELSVALPAKTKQGAAGQER
ncbi:F0F1 ATP synthase subunit B [Arcanobacterium hippocoleae]|uniref:ATP synthase subunit b n=1 Tax=Arcanobacterium hippocoleae TaxID=149017 RepID=A0ABU1T437_9ACTO|nr:F0F1 ATP synthase subunit B [Arcanobacterium hippocoleae]MDR6939980.1 F-type H+-transporting ATPase subunit b [Arcanobacterium hippocoleae]